jgi:hypothetical protein
MSLEYKLGIFRYSKTYTFKFSKDSVRRKDDDDDITFNHHLNFIFPQFRGLDAEVFGEYSIHSINYLKKEWSAANNTENGYLLGLNFIYKPSERFTISEWLRANAEVFDYFYKRSHLNDPPAYNRRFSSVCTGTWKITDRWELNGRWDENYDDDGVWNGHDYFDTTRPDSLGTDFYAIMNKFTRYSIELGLVMVGQKFRIENGCRLEDEYNRFYQDSAYQTKDNGVGYKVEPFTVFVFNYHRFSLRGRIARLFNTLAPDKLVFRKNWDIHISGQATW